MEHPSISEDDLIDVMEMTDKLEKYISKIFKDNQCSLALSALMSATINSMLAQCKTLDEVVLYRNIFVQMLDASIRGIKIKKPDQ
jgi:hypothetical protein